MTAVYRRGIWLMERTSLGMLVAMVFLGVGLTAGCGGGEKDDAVRRNGANRGSTGSNSSQEGPVVRDRPTSPHQAREQLTPVEIPDVDVVAIRPEQVKTERDAGVLTKVLIEAEEPKSRQEAARALGRQDVRSALPALLDALSDDDLTVRVYAISAINDITNMRFIYAPDSPKDVREPQARDLRNYLRQAGAIP